MPSFLLRTFGGLTLERDGRPYDPLSGQRRALGLLAAIAAAGELGLARERAMLLLWPESTTERASGSLKQLLHTVRRQLGDPRAVTGVAELRLEPRYVASDVARFREALAAGDDGAAVALYAGPFLDAVHLGDADEFERWASGERSRLAGAYAEALERLARSAVTEGRPADAVGWWRRLRAEEPLNGRVVLGLMEALEGAGDPAGALLEARRHEATLREELGAFPDPAVLAFAEELKSGRSPALRAGAGSAIAESSAGDPRVGGSGAGGPGPGGSGSARWTAEDPADGGPTAGDPRMGRRARPTAARENVPAPGRPAHPRPRLRRAAVLGAVLLTIVAIGAARLGRSPGAEPLVANRVAVAVFVDRTNTPALEALGTMAADWVTRGLAENSRLEVFDIGALYLSGRAADGAPTDPRALARASGAGLVLAGNYYRHADSLIFSAQVIDVASGQVLRLIEPASGPLEDPLSTVEEVRRRAAAALGTIVDPRVSILASPGMVPPKYEAFAAYVAGQEVYWRGDWAASLPFFRRAAVLDTNFTAPLVYVGVAGIGTARCDLADSVLAVLEERRERVPEIELITARISVARCASDHPEHNRLQRRRAELRPGSKAIQLTMSTGFRQLNRPGEALAIIADIDPVRDLGWLPERGRSLYWREVSASRHALGEYRAEGAIAEPMREHGAAALAVGLVRARSFAAIGMPDSALASIEAVSDAAPDPALLSGITGRLDPVELATPGWVMHRAALELAAHGHGAAARAAAERSIAWYGREEAAEPLSSTKRFVLAGALELAGRLDEARALLEKLAAEDTASVDFRGALGALAARQGDAATAAEVDAWLAARPRAFPIGSPLLHRSRIATLRSQTARALDLLEALPHGAHPHDFLEFHVDPAFASLRSEERFRKLLVPRG